jgi:O-antigen/teichoic acid export membrane protein
MISFAAAGAYRALQNLVAPIHLLLRATDTFLTPRAARVYHENGLPAVQRLLRLAYLGSAVPVLGLLALAMLFPRALLAFLYGETYLEYSPAMVWMAAFYMLLYTYSPLQSVLKAVRLSRPIFIANLAAGAAMFTIGLWAIQKWGVYGTIAGQILNAAIVTAVLGLAWIVFRKKSELAVQAAEKIGQLGPNENE